MSFRTAYGNSWSENGWRMVNRDSCILVPGPYMNTAPIREGAPAIILGDFARRYHVECAPIVSSVWGWSLYNDVGNSNHLAGTALDINAPQWPWGLRWMPADLKARISKLLDSYRVDGQPGVYWGDWWNKADQMHFQLGFKEGDKRNDILVARIQKGPVVPPPSVPGSTPTWNPTLMYGSSGAAVAELQRDMNRIFRGYPMMPLDVDGDFGPRTQAAVKEFQRRVKLDPDGIVGPLTWTEFAKFGVKL